MSNNKVVITGAPGTGKTSIVNELEKTGLHCFHEIIRDMTSKAKKEGGSNNMVSNPLVFVDDSLQFNKDLLYGRAAHFQQAVISKTDVHIFDRGIPDVLAYMDFFDQSYGREFISTCENHRYDMIFIAPPWKEIYISDNERLETFEEAQSIHDALMHTYTRFGYDPILIPKKTVPERVSFVLETINKI